MMLRVVAIAAAVAFIASPATQGSEWRYAVEYRPFYSSNIARTADNEIEEYTNGLLLELGFRERSSALEGSVAARVEYLTYRSGLFADETRTALNADLRWALLRDRIFWVVEDLATIEPVVYRQARTPGNVQQTNLFVTGPSLSHRLGDSGKVTADLRFMNSYAEITREFRSNRWHLALGLVQQYSLYTDLSANLSLISTDYALEYADDFRQANLYLAWDRHRGSSGFRLELGRSAVRFDDGEERNAPHLRWVWNRVISSASRMRMILGHGFSDAAQYALGRDRDTPVGERRFATASNIISSQVYEGSELDLVYRLQWARSDLEIGMNHQRQIYPRSPDMDQNLLNARVEWSTGFHGGMSTDLGISFSRTEYGWDERVDDTMAPYFGLHMQRSSRVYYGIRAGREIRESSEDGSDYDDTVISLRLGYRH